MTLSCIGNAQWVNIYKFPNLNSPKSFITCGNNLYVGLGGGGVFSSQDSGVNWFPVNKGIQMGGAYIFSLTSRNDSIYAGGFGEVCFSKNAGANWSLLDLNLSLNSNVNALVVKDNYIFAGVGHDNANGVYRKQLNGLVWEQMNKGLPENVAINAFAVNDTSLFAGTNLGVYKSLDNGLNWTLSNNGIGDGLYIKSFHVVNGNLLAGTSNGVFVSSDDGSNWNSSSGLPLKSGVTSFASNSNGVVAGTYNGVFLSTDNGLTWKDFSNELVSGSIYALTSLGNYFYAAAGGGVFTTNTSLPVSVSKIQSEIDEDCLIYPNPFSSQVTLQTKNMIKNATLTIYNLQGQAVKQICNLTGQTIIVHRDNLPSGQYFIRLVQDDKVIATDKLIITDN